VDNVNIVRAGYIAPVMRIPDTDGEMADPIDRVDARFTCLAFVNPDAQGALIVRALENKLPRTASGLEQVLAVVMPCRQKAGRRFKKQTRFTSRAFCDPDLRCGHLFGIVDSSSARPAYHPAVFVVGDDGIVRYRQLGDYSGFHTHSFLAAAGTLT